MTKYLNYHHYRYFLFKNKNNIQLKLCNDDSEINFTCKLILNSRHTYTA